MVPALNSKERNKAFWKFILFFSITVVVIIMAVFVNFIVPSKENKILRDKAKVYEAHMSAEEKFTIAIQETDRLLDSLDRPDVNDVYVNQLIGVKISQMTTLQASNSDASKKDKLFLDILLKYQQTKSRLSKLGDAATALQKSKSEYTECQQLLNEARQTITQYQMLQKNGGL